MWVTLHLRWSEFGIGPMILEGLAEFREVVNRSCMDVSSEDGSNGVRVRKKVEEDLEKNNSRIKEKDCRDIAWTRIERHCKGNGFTHIIVCEGGSICID